MTEPQVLTVFATDAFGETNTETLIVQLAPGGEFVQLEPRDGKKLLVATDELREALS